MSSRPGVLMRRPVLHSQLVNERQQLAKAVQHIELGWARFRRQEHALDELRAHGRDTVEAERLQGLTSRMLIEWERHRQLIAERIAYLEGEIAK